MTDQTMPPPSPPAMPPPKRKYVRQHPIKKQATARAEPETREEEVRSKKVRVRKQIGAGPLDIPQNIVKSLNANGIDLMWATNTVLGAPAPQSRQAFEINAWEPVSPEMWGGVLDGMFTPKGYRGEIIVDACVLLWRPMELSDEARAEERQSAETTIRAHTARLNGGQIDGVTMDTSHPHARAVTRVSREILQVPKN